MQATTTQEGTTMETTLTYNSPEAKARIKELKALEADVTAQLKAANARMGAYEDAQRAANPDYRSWKDGSDTRAALAAEQDALRTAYYAARNERLEAQTCPLPCEPRNLPSTYVPGKTGNVDHLVQGPQDTAAYTAGDLVTVYSRGGWRQAVVVEARKLNLEVAYTTQGSRDEAMRYGRGPNGVTVTRKTVKLADVYGHEPQQQPAPAAPVAPVLEGGEATTADELQALRDELASHKPGYKAYVEARDDLKRSLSFNEANAPAQPYRDAMEAHRPAYTAYKRVYRQLLAATKAATPTGEPVDERPAHERMQYTEPGGGTPARAYAHQLGMRQGIGRLLAKAREDSFRVPERARWNASSRVRGWGRWHAGWDYVGDVSYAPAADGKHTVWLKWNGGDHDSRKTPEQREATAREQMERVVVALAEAGFAWRWVELPVGTTGTVEPLVEVAANAS
jgi:hypothetical protein